MAICPFWSFSGEDYRQPLIAQCLVEAMVRLERATRRGRGRVKHCAIAWTIDTAAKEFLCGIVAFAQTRAGRIAARSAAEDDRG